MPVGGIDWSRVRAFCKIIVDGQDVTSRFAPYLLQVSVIDTEGEIDTATIELSDRHGVIKMPTINGKVKIELGWHDGTLVVFNGTIDDIESHGQRKQGRHLTLHCTSASLTDTVKQPLRMTLGEGEKPEEDSSQGGVAGTAGSRPGDSTAPSSEKVKLEDAFKKFAEGTGLQVKIHKSLGQLERSAWSITNESVMSWARRTGREVGGLVKIQGDTITMVPQNGNENADGQQIQTVDARWAQDGNLLAWRIHPVTGRSQWKGASTSFFDRLASIRRYSNAHIETLFGDTRASFFNILSAAESAQAKQQADSDSGTSSRNAGLGWIVIVGEPRAQPRGMVNLQGVRDGVDGGYHIKQVEHTYSRGGGYESRLDVIHPLAGAKPSGTALNPSGG